MADVPVVDPDPPESAVSSNAGDGQTGAILADMSMDHEDQSSAVFDQTPPQSLLASTAEDGPTAAAVADKSSEDDGASVFKEGELLGVAQALHDADMEDPALARDLEDSTSSATDGEADTPAVELLPGQVYTQQQIKEILSKLPLHQQAKFEDFSRRPSTVESCKPADGKTTTGGLVDEKTVKILRDSVKSVPPFIHRVASEKGMRHTPGISNDFMFLPAANKRHMDVFGSIAAMDEHHAARTVGNHLAWVYRKVDEFTSWTMSLIFVLAHMHGRHEKNQFGVYNCSGDRRRLTTRDGAMAEFYPANMLLKRFTPVLEKLTERGTKDQVPRWIPRVLHPRHFAHEMLAVGEIRDESRSMIHVSLEAMVLKGLYELFPEVRIEDLSPRSRLYRQQVGLKTQTFYTAAARPITQKELKLADDLASLFERADQNKAPLWLFLQFLTLRKRPKVNGEFREWVLERYNEDDVRECMYHNMHNIPVCQPDCAQTYILFQECARLLGVPVTELPDLEHDRGYDDNFSEEFLSYRTAKDLDVISQKMIDRNIIGKWNCDSFKHIDLDPAAVQGRRTLVKELMGDMDEDLLAGIEIELIEAEHDGPDEDEDGNDNDERTTTRPRKKRKIAKDKFEQGLVKQIDLLSKRLCWRKTSRDQLAGEHQYFQQNSMPALLGTLANSASARQQTGATSQAVLAPQTESAEALSALSVPAPTLSEVLETFGSSALATGALPETESAVLQIGQIEVPSHEPFDENEGSSLAEETPRPAI